MGPAFPFSTFCSELQVSKTSLRTGLRCTELPPGAPHVLLVPVFQQAHPFLSNLQPLQPLSWVPQGRAGREVPGVGVIVPRLVLHA